jgi:hypothetical protein
VIAGTTGVTGCRLGDLASGTASKFLPMNLHPSSILAAAIFAAVVASPASGQGSSAMEKMEHHGSTSWKELDAFHAVLAATWHPVSGKGDFSVIRLKADSLSATAKRWSSSKFPAACDTKEIRDVVTAVTKGSDAVAALVAKQAADAEVKTALSAVHEKFEAVEKGCHA